MDRDDLAAVALGAIERRLAFRYRWADADLIHDATIGAVIDHLANPERYDPSRRSLASYLVMSATGDLLNLAARHQPTLSLGPDHPAEDRTAAMDDAMDAAALRERIGAVPRDADERVVLALMLDGERGTAVFAAALGWRDLPWKEQQARVYRVKDRLTERLRRALGRSPERTAHPSP